MVLPMSTSFAPANEKKRGLVDETGRREKQGDVTVNERVAAAKETAYVVHRWLRVERALARLRRRLSGC